MASQPFFMADSFRVVGGGALASDFDSLVGAGLAGLDCLDHYFYLVPLSHRAGYGRHERQPGH